MKKCRRVIAGILLLSLAFSGAPQTGLAAKTASSLTYEGRFPTRYDLRDDGVVTPVKCQSPFGCCWAFAALAAAETSILSAAGVTYAQTVDKDGKGFDLSEKHLENTGEGKSAKTDLFRVAEKTITVTVKVKKKG